MTTILKPPGLYPNVPFAEYLRYEGLSQTTLKAGLRSPKHLRHAATQAARPPSPAQILGEALHTRVLEPERFASRLSSLTPIMFPHTMPNLRKAGRITVVKAVDPAEQHGPPITDEQRRALHAIRRCRTPASGGQRYRCAHCGGEHHGYHSCHHRACPRCGGPEHEGECDG